MKVLIKNTHSDIQHFIKGP